VPGLAAQQSQGTQWKPCYACGSAEVPVPIEAAGAERVAAAIADVRRPDPAGG
jgi:hypothetical protein